MLRLQYETRMTVSIIVTLLCLIFINILAIQFNRRIDLTKKKVFTLSPHTLKVLSLLKKKIKGKIKMIAFYETGYPDREEIEDLLSCYKLAARDILDIKIVDPDKNPGLARKYDLRVYGVTVVEHGNKAIRVTGISEEKITNALIRILEEQGKVIYFTQGHGEGTLDGFTKADYLSAVRALENEGYIVRELKLYETGLIPEDCAVLVVAGPKKDLFEREVQIIDEYLKKGGSVLFMLDPGHCDNLVEYFKKWGVDLGKNEIVDPVSKLFGGDLTMPVITNFNWSHEITRDFDLPVLFPGSRTVFPLKDIRNRNLKVAELTYTNPNCGAEVDFKDRRFIYDPGRDLKGRLTNAVAVSCGKTRIVVVGDSDFATNAAIRFSGNRDFFVNIINWLARKEEFISIRPRVVEAGNLAVTQHEGNIHFFLSMILLPFIIALIGASVWLRRRTL